MTLAREPEEGSWFTFEGEDNVTVTGLPDSGYSLAGYWTHDWAFEMLRVASVSNGVARFKDRHVFGIGKTSWGQKKRRFYAVGHRSFLDTEGEWLVEGSTLFFIPPGGDIASKPVTIAWGDEPVLLLEHWARLDEPGQQGRAQPHPRPWAHDLERQEPRRVHDGRVP